jgi:hypothetical protein
MSPQRIASSRKYCQRLDDLESGKIETVEADEALRTIDARLRWHG